MMKMGNIRTFRDLIVRQKSVGAAMRSYRLSPQFPASEQFLLTNQAVRSSRSVTSQVAEVWRRRRYPAAWLNKLNEAEGETAETQTHLDFALRCQYMAETEHLDLDAPCEEILHARHMIDHPEQWTLR